jgi:hypothetical protein
MDAAERRAQLDHLLRARAPGTGVLAIGHRTAAAYQAQLLIVPSTPTLVRHIQPGRCDNSRSPQASRTGRESQFIGIEMVSRAYRPLTEVVPRCPALGVTVASWASSRAVPLAFPPPAADAGIRPQAMYKHIACGAAAGRNRECRAGQRRQAFDNEHWPADMHT